RVRGDEKKLLAIGIIQQGAKNLVAQVSNLCRRRLNPKNCRGAIYGALKGSPSFHRGLIPRCSQLVFFVVAQSIAPQNRRDESRPYNCGIVVLGLRLGIK
ncbi:MAG: hypothetical protein WAU47_08025, partial [Desulfobaccales bacterium]